MAWLIFAVAGPILIGVLAGAWYLRPAKLGDDGCPIDDHRAPPAKTVLLIDQTDALPPAELDYVRRLVKNEYFWLPDKGMLAVRLISAAAPDGIDAVSACRMSDGSDAAGIVNNPKAMRKEYDRKVGARLDAFLHGMAGVPEQPASPILETITATMHDPDFASDIAARRLVVVSDMAQNSATYSQYGTWKKAPLGLNPAQAEAYAGSLANTAVRIHYIRRAKLTFQGQAHRDFWTRFFITHGAADARIGHELSLGEPADRAIWYDRAAEPPGSGS